MATDENGLYYMRARYYNSEIKRFVNQDVLIGTISDSPTMNRYAYVNGNPISLSDPFGLSPSLNWLGHAVLDVLGLIPGIGIAFDIANAIWYFAEGDIFGGICSLIGILPVVGDAIGLAGKGIKAVENIASFTKALGYSGNFIMGSYVISNVVVANVQRYVINKEKFSWKQFAIDLATVGLELLVMRNSVKGLKSLSTTISTPSTPKSPYLDVPSSKDGTLNIGAGSRPLKGAYNIDLNPRVDGVHYGNALDLGNIASNSQSRIIIENPHGYDAMNSEIIRVLQPGGVIEITGSLNNGAVNRAVKQARKLGFTCTVTDIPNVGQYTHSDGSLFPPGQPEFFKKYILEHTDS